CGCVAEVTGDRLGRILAALSAGEGVWSSARLCGACPGIVGVTGAGVMLMSGDVPRGSLSASDEVSRLIEELQYTLGEGPGVDAGGGLETRAGGVAGELEAVADCHFAVHNAAVIVSVQEGISVTEALIRLRAFAFSSDRLLDDVAQDIIARRLRLG